jgi:hypothetical protein
MAKTKQQNGATPVSSVTVAQRLAVLEQQLMAQRQAKEQHQQLAQAAESAIQRLIGAISVLHEVQAETEGSVLQPSGHRE